MSYTRVIPRDLFNEAGLLKCLGRLYIETERFQPGVLLKHDYEPFDIRQDESDGSITVANIRLVVNGDEYAYFRPCNSRQPFPLYLNLGDNVVRIFTDDGKLSDDFISLLQATAAIGESL